MIPRWVIVLYLVFVAFVVCSLVATVLWLWWQKRRGVVMPPVDEDAFQRRIARAINRSLNIPWTR
jgi:hypothetical protein